MKKKINKKLAWQFSLSVVIFCGFICLALETEINLPDKETSYNKTEKTYTEIVNRNGRKYKMAGPKDEKGDWNGWVKVVTPPDVKEGEEPSAEMEIYYLHGLKHGKVTGKKYYHSDPDVTEYYCFYMDIPIDCDNEKSSFISTENASAFEIFKSKYPLFSFVFYCSGISEEIVKAYIDSIQTKMYEFELEESEFDDTYTLLLDDFEDSNFDSVYQVHDQEALYQGFNCMKRAEFRRAVIDAYRSSEANTFNTIKTFYPNYVQTLGNPYITDSLFQLFCADFDSVMVIKGPLNPDDPFFSDSVDIRMIYSLLYLYIGDESTDEAISNIKSAYLNKKIHDLSSLRKLAFPLLEKLKSDPVSSPIANFVVRSMAPKYYEGDKIRLAVHEAYNLQKGIITVPVTKTVFLENLSSSIVQLEVFVFEDGGAEVTERGIVWADFYNPTIDDNKESYGSGLGEFEVTLSGLSPGTEYYARSYAQNSTGISYGNCIQFTTLTTGSIKVFNPEINFNVYPNPASQEINVDFCLESNDIVQVMFVNMKGQVVFQNEYKEILPGQNQIKIDLSDFENGIYNCRLFHNGAIGSKKIIIMR